MSFREERFKDFRSSLMHEVSLSVYFLHTLLQFEKFQRKLSNDPIQFAVEFSSEFPISINNVVFLRFYCANFAKNVLHREKEI